MGLIDECDFWFLWEKSSRRWWNLEFMGIWKEFRVLDWNKRGEWKEWELKFQLEVKILEMEEFDPICGWLEGYFGLSKSSIYHHRLGVYVEYLENSRRHSTYMTA